MQCKHSRTSTTQTVCVCVFMHSSIFRRPLNKTFANRLHRQSSMGYYLHIDQFVQSCFEIAFSSPNYNIQFHRIKGRTLNVKCHYRFLISLTSSMSRCKRALIQCVDCHICHRCVLELICATIQQTVAYQFRLEKCSHRKIY